MRAVRSGSSRDRLSYLNVIAGPYKRACLVFVGRIHVQFGSILGCLISLVCPLILLQHGAGLGDWQLA